MSSEADTPDDPKASARPREVFSVYANVSGRAATFEEPREAGRAFFMADPVERPSVTHTMGSGARTMARTEVHGVHPSGEPRYFKSLPSSHAPDAAFREGFLEAMETSIKERLGKVTAVKESGRETSINTRLVDDLEAFAYREPARAAQLWAGHSRDLPPGQVLKAAVDAHALAQGREAAVGRIAQGEVSGLRLHLAGRVQGANRPLTNQKPEDWER